MSLKTVEGLVVRTSERQVNTAKGIATSFSVLINEGGAEDWYSFGFKNPNIKADQMIKFVAKQNGNFWNGDPQTIETTARPEAASNATRPSVKATLESADNRQRSIVWQSSYRTAVDLANVFLTHQYAGLPASAKKGDKYDYLLELVDNLAMRVYAVALNPPEPQVLTVPQEDEAASIADEDYNPV